MYGVGSFESRAGVARRLRGRRAGQGRRERRLRRLVKGAEGVEISIIHKCEYLNAEFILPS